MQSLQRLARTGNAAIAQSLVYVSSHLRRAQCVGARLFSVHGFTAAASRDVQRECNSIVYGGRLRSLPAEESTGGCTASWTRCHLRSAAPPRQSRGDRRVARE